MYAGDQSLQYLILIVLPVIIWHAFIFKGKAFIIYLIISVAIIAGSLELIFRIDENTILLIPELLAWFLLFVVLIGPLKKEFPYWILLSGFCLTCFISYILNDVNYVQLTLFIRKYSMPIVIFYLFQNISLSKDQSDRLLKYFTLLFIVQVFVNIVKYVIIGSSENYIGTMAVQNGSITTIFTLLSISFAFNAYLVERKKIYILLIFGFFLFSIIGDKRATIFISPIMLLIMYFLYMVIVEKRQLLKNVVSILLICLISASLLLAGLRFTASLRYEAMGGFDIAYVMEYLDQQLFQETEFRGTYEARGSAPGAYYNLIRKAGWAKALFGFGPGDIMGSRFTTPSSAVRSEEYIAGLKYGIGYGSRTGLIYTAMQVGLIGTIFYFIFFIRAIYTNVEKKTMQNNKNKISRIISLSLLASIFVFIFDFFAYSRLFLHHILFITTVFYASYYLRTLDPQNNHSPENRAADITLAS